MSKKSTPELYNHTEIERLAADPHNCVFEYIHDEPTRRYTAEEQKQLINEIRARSNDLRSRATTLTDDEIRKQLRAIDHIATFAQNNERIFNLVTDRNTTLDKFNHIRYMLYLRDQMEKKNINEADAQALIQNYLIENMKTGMTLEEYKRLMGDGKTKK